MSTMDIGNHGVKINGVHPNNNQCGITVEGDFLPFNWDDESIFFNISKPTEEELLLYKVYELNANTTPNARKIRRQRSKTFYKFADIPISELRKRFAMLPEDTITRTLQNTTQFYTEIQEENQTNPSKHFRKRFKALQYNRQHEAVATDFTFLSSNTSQGHKGGQFFSGVTSKKWAFHPLKKESQCVAALQDYIREHGPPDTIISDNAKSETSDRWNTVLRDAKISTRTSEPHHPHQNPAEPEWGRLSKMVQNCLRTFNAPVELSNWCLLWCCQVNNHVSRRSLNYRTPEEVSTGRTPDISKFRFHFYEPLWFFEPNIKTPNDNLLKARFLAIAESCGDVMTYYILTEPELAKTKRQILMRSVIKTRRKNIGATDEYINDNPDMEKFTLSLTEATRNRNDIKSSDEVPILIPGEKIANAYSNRNDDEELTIESEPSDAEDEASNHMDQSEEQLPTDMDATNDAESHNIIAESIDPNLHNTMVLTRILDHFWTNGILVLKTQYIGNDGRKFVLDTPFTQLKEDEPIPCAKYVREYIAEERRGNRPFNEWANKTLKIHGKTIRRMRRVNPNWRSNREDVNTSILRNAIKIRTSTIRVRKIFRKKQESRNSRVTKQKNREKFGIPIPNTIKDAIRYDTEASNTKWADAIKKEMDNLDRLEVFKYLPSNTKFDAEDGWQQAPLRMIFDVKNEDRRYKARLVVGGHKVDSSEYNTFSSQVDTLSVLLLFLVCKHQKLSLMTADVGNAFPTAPNQEKVWCTAGPEFGTREGSKIEI
jgi:hypothetical protein